MDKIPPDQGFLSPGIFELTRVNGEPCSYLEVFYTEDDGYVFSHSHGEFAYHVWCEDGVYKFGESSRGGTVFPKAVSPDQSIIERVLIYTLGYDYRPEAGLPGIAIPLVSPPYTKEHIREGFTAVYLSEEEWVLQRPDGTRLPATFIGSRRNWAEKARYSYIMDIPVPEFVASYLDPEGYPALHEFV